MQKKKNGVQLKKHRRFQKNCRLRHRTPLTVRAIISTFTCGTEEVILFLYTVGQSMFILSRCWQIYNNTGTQIIGKLYNNCRVKIQDTHSLLYPNRVLETWGIRVRKHELIMGSAVQVMTNLSG